MKSIKIINGVLVLVFVFAGALQAGAPLNNLEGVGGIAFNPLAYPANACSDGLTCGNITISKPQLGVWYVKLDNVGIDWGSTGVAATINKRLELSVGYERITDKKLDLNINKTSFGQKLLLLKENECGSNFIPAISIGAIEKITSKDMKTPGVDQNGVDFYVVVTKLITQLPRPVLISGGMISTREWVTGALGFDDDRRQTGFANIDILPTCNTAVGYEFKQGAKFSDFKNADYWDAHIAWLPTKELTLVAAYVDTGDEKSTTRVGLGNGVVLSAQYAF